MIINIPSTHGSDKPLDASAIVIHAAAEYIRFEDRDIHIVEYIRSRGLSYHAYVLPSGDVIRTRDDNQVAWHCKAQGYNWKSLGLCFVVAGAWKYDEFLEVIDTDWLLEKQYDAGVQLVKDWMEPGKIKEVERHCMIDPDRRTDPGKGFPWLNFSNEVLTGLNVK